MEIFNSKFINEYAKKIFAFAYGKTGNIYDAEDLSQEILTSLFTSIPKYSKIENIDGFVWTICYHSWSNFYRKNKRHWDNDPIDDMEISDDSDVQNEVETAIFIGKMKTEIAYLSKLHRDIITMTYYDGKSSGQISKELNISDSTIRWHLVEIRKKLKGRIEMNNQNLNYKPIALKAWQNGDRNSTRGIGQYRLVDNICYLCYGAPLTIEEISRRLSVAAVFIEQHIEELVFMDYLKIVDGGKHQTNFFIRTQAFYEIERQYSYNNVKNKAGKLFEALEKRYGDIKAINFTGSDLDKDFVTWVLIHHLVNRLQNKANSIIWKKKEYLYCMPKRKDGSKHWLLAELQDDNYVTSLPEEVTEFDKKGEYRSSGAWAPNEICSFQVTSYATFQVGDRRIFWGDELQKISRIAEISRNNLTLSEYDKTLIAIYAEAGLAEVDGDRVRMLIPYLTKDEYEKL